jgi:DNA-binding cell septation regulator SpoVG
MVSPTISIRRWTAGTADDVRSGLLAFVQVQYGAVIIDVTARRTADGRLVLSYPERRDRMGRRHSLVRPIDDAARREIESAVFREATAARGVEP